MWQELQHFLSHFHFRLAKKNQTSAFLSSIVNREKAHKKNEMEIIVEREMRSFFFLSLSVLLLMALIFELVWNETLCAWLRDTCACSVMYAWNTHGTFNEKLNNGFYWCFVVLLLFIERALIANYIIMNSSYHIMILTKMLLHITFLFSFGSFFFTYYINCRKAHSYPPQKRHLFNDCVGFHMI